MENRMVHWQFLQLAVRKNALDFTMEILPLRVAPEIVYHEKSAVEQVTAQDGHFLVHEPERARLHYVNPGMVDQVRIGRIDNTAVRIHEERGHLLEAEREVQVAVRTIGARAAVTPTIRLPTVPDAGKGKDILLECRRVGPVRCPGAVGRQLARGTGGLKIAAIPPAAPALGHDNSRGQRENEKDPSELL